MELEHVAGDRVRVPAQEVPVAARVDVLVAGGGSAGLAAAVAAARSGARTLLIERNSFLGGAATAGLVAEFGGQGGYENMSGVAREMADRMIARGGARKGKYRTSFELETYKTVSLNLMEESGARLLLYTATANVITEGKRVRGALIHNKSGFQAVLADVTIDTTGDADLAYWAGVPTVKGREGDSKMRPIGLMFRVGNIDIDRLLRYVKENPEEFSPDPSKNIMELDANPPMFRPMGFFSTVEKAKQAGEFPSDLHYLRLDNVNMAARTCIVNAVRVYGADATDGWQLTQAEMRAREQMHLLMRFLEKHIPGFENCFLIDAGANLGIRETRRIIGEYVLQEDDIMSGVWFPDSIGTPGYRHTKGMPVHSPDGREGAPDDIANRKVVDELVIYHIPYRSLVPLGVEGLLVAGRCISATHEADAVTRVQPSCMIMGQAAGTAAAMAVRQGCDVRAVPMPELQANLVAQGVRILFPQAEGAAMS